MTKLKCGEKISWAPLRARIRAGSIYPPSAAIDDAEDQPVLLEHREVAAGSEISRTGECLAVHAEHAAAVDDRHRVKDLIAAALVEADHEQDVEAGRPLEDLPHFRRIDGEAVLPGIVAMEEVAGKERFGKGHDLDAGFLCQLQAVEHRLQVRVKIALAARTLVMPYPNVALRVLRSLPLVPRRLGRPAVRLLEGNS